MGRITKQTTMTARTSNGMTQSSRRLNMSVLPFVCMSRTRFCVRMYQLMTIVTLGFSAWSVRAARERSRAVSMSYVARPLRIDIRVARRVSRVRSGGRIRPRLKIGRVARIRVSWRVERAGRPHAPNFFFCTTNNPTQILRSVHHDDCVFLHPGKDSIRNVLYFQVLILY